jgi:hypothetical protein
MNNIQLYSPQQPQIVYVPAQPYPAPGPYGNQDPYGRYTHPHPHQHPPQYQPVQYAQQHQIPGPGTFTHVAVHRNGEQLERTTAKTIADAEIEMLGLVLRDFGAQMRDATMKVRKQLQSEMKQRPVTVAPLRRMEGPRATAATDGKLSVTRPTNQFKTLELVQRLITLLSSKLVPTITQERQLCLSYVLSMIETYIGQVGSLVTGNFVEDAEPSEYDDDELRSLKHALSGVDAAEVSIPSTIDSHHDDLADKIEKRCKAILERIRSAREGEPSQRTGHTRRHDTQGSGNSTSAEQPQPMLLRTSRFGQKKAQLQGKLNEAASVSVSGRSGET